VQPAAAYAGRRGATHVIHVGCPFLRARGVEDGPAEVFHAREQARTGCT